MLNFYLTRLDASVHYRGMLTGYCRVRNFRCVYGFANGFECVLMAGVRTFNLIAVLCNFNLFNAFLVALRYAARLRRRVTPIRLLSVLLP